MYKTDYLKKDLRVAYCTINVKIPKAVNHDDVKRLFQDDSQYASTQTEIGKVTSQFQHYSKNIHFINFFSAKTNSHCMYSLYINGEDIEIHCELSRKDYKYDQLYRQGIKIISDIERVLSKKVELTDFTVFDPCDESIFTVKKYSFMELYKFNFSESWIDRSIMLLVSAIVAALSSEKSFIDVVSGNKTAVIIYSVAVLGIPSIKATFWENKKYKIMYGGK